MSYKSNPFVDNIIALRLLTMLTTPFKEYPAYKLGLIDEKGNYIIPKSKRTAVQNRSHSYLDRLLINVKKMINKLPGGENKLKNVISAMVLIKESYQNQTNPTLLKDQQLIDFVNNYSMADDRYRKMLDVWMNYEQYKTTNEDVGAAAISGGIANNTNGIAGYDSPLIMQRRGATVVKKQLDMTSLK